MNSKTNARPAFWPALAAVLCSLLAVAPATAASPSPEQFSIGLTKGRHLLELIPGGDGNMWFIGSGCVGRDCSGGGRSAIGRITPRGKITEFKRGFPLDRGADISGLTWGPDNNLWFLGPRTRTLGRMTPSGKVTIFRSGLPARFEGTGEILTGPDGLFYVPASWRSAGGRARGFVRIGLDGSRQLITMNTTVNLWLSLAGDGNFWNTGIPARGQSPYFQRITPSGVVTRFAEGLEDLRYLCGGPPAIATDGSVWCHAITRPNARVVLRLDPVTGQLQRFETTAIPKFARPGGAWWYVEASGPRSRGRSAATAATRKIELWQITATGHDTRIAGSRLAAGESVLGSTPCVARDNSLFYASLPRRVATPIRLRRLRPGASSSTSVTVALGYSVGAADDLFSACITGPDGNIWFLNNGAPRRGLRSDEYRHRIGRITIG